MNQERDVDMAERSTSNQCLVETVGVGDFNERGSIGTVGVRHDVGRLGVEVRDQCLPYHTYRRSGCHGCGRRRRRHTHEDGGGSTLEQWILALAKTFPPNLSPSESPSNDDGQTPILSLTHTLTSLCDSERVT